VTILCRLRGGHFGVCVVDEYSGKLRDGFAGRVGVGLGVSGSRFWISEMGYIKRDTYSMVYSLHVDIRQSSNVKQTQM
jgi:hypothetical protein